MLRRLLFAVTMVIAFWQGPQPTEPVAPAEAPGKVEAAVSGWFERQRSHAEERFLRALEASDPTPRQSAVVDPPEAIAEPAADVFDTFAIVGPVEPIRTPQQVTLKVVGLTDAELPQASIDVSPPLDYTPVKTWTGETVILVPITSATKAGKYTFTVSLNAWRLKVDEGLVAARQAQVPQDLLDEYFALSKKLAEKYPAKAATCAIEVALGPFQPPIDPDKPPPDPPVDPNQKTTQVTFVFEKDSSNTPRQVALALQRLNAAGVLATEFEEDATDGNGEVPDQYKIALEAARKAGLPALVVQSGNVVKRVIQNPTTTEQVMEAAK